MNNRDHDLIVLLLLPFLLISLPARNYERKKKFHDDRKKDFFYWKENTKPLKLSRETWKIVSTPDKRFDGDALTVTFCISSMLHCTFG